MSLGDGSMAEQPRSKLDNTDQAVAIYHVVYQREGFEKSAQILFQLVREAQQNYPNKRRALFLDIENHRNEQGGFDADMFELQNHFLIGFLARFLSEIH